MNNTMAKEFIAVLDFGGQYNQLIARRIREAGVYSEVIPYNTPFSDYVSPSLKGIILTGGPNSVYAPGALRCSKEVFALGVPVLGICYGMQYIAHRLGGVRDAPPRLDARVRSAFRIRPERYNRRI